MKAVMLHSFPWPGLPQCEQFLAPILSISWPRGFTFLEAVKFPVAIRVERLRHTEQSGVANVPSALLQTETEGKGRGRCFQLFDSQAPGRCPVLYIEPAQFSAAHTLQQQRGGEALHSVQLQLF